jgi:hypothetical protein
MGCGKTLPVKVVCKTPIIPEELMIPVNADFTKKMYEILSNSPEERTKQQND